MRQRAVREKYGLTQVEFGKLIGVKVTAVSRYENGWRIPGSPVMRRIAETFPEIDIRTYYDMNKRRKRAADPACELTQ